LATKCGDDNSRVFTGHLYERDKTRMTFHQSRNVTVPGAANEIAFPMTGNGAILDFCGPFPDRDSIDDLTAGLSADTRVLRAAYAALGSQVPNQLFFQLSIRKSVPATNPRSVYSQRSSATADARQEGTP
jgi:hypothetical protein